MNIVPRSPSLGANHQQRLAALHERTARLHLFEFWGTDSSNEHQATDKLRADRTPAVPHIWKYRDVHPCLLEAAELVPTEMSERRSIIMVNPALRPYVATTTNLFAAYRINMPHEMMPPHRHSPNAIRFGLTGNTNFTGVQGENIMFGPGDLVLTPHDTWHNHGNGPEEASVNLSVLDMPLVNALNATYFEFDYKEMEGGKLVEKKVQSAKVADDYSLRYYGAGGLVPRFIDHRRGAGTSSPMFVYRWEQTEKMLRRVRDHEGSPYEGILIEYVNPTTGEPVYKTMTFFIQLLRPGERLLPLRQNASLICTVFSGRGQSIVGGEVFDWEPFDTFCVPGGEWLEHANASTGEDAILLVSSDEPTLRKLGFALKHGRDRNGDLAVLESSTRSGS
ncbi:MAG: cupin domain-containing protein [Xanthobacteraceae bacterium]